MTDAYYEKTYSELIRSKRYSEAITLTKMYVTYLQDQEIERLRLVAAAREHLEAQNYGHTFGDDDTCIICGYSKREYHALSILERWKERDRITCVLRDKIQGRRYES